MSRYYNDNYKIGKYDDKKDKEYFRYICEFCNKSNHLNFNFLNNEPNTQFNCKWCYEICGYINLCKIDNTKSFSFMNNIYCKSCSKTKFKEQNKDKKSRSRSRSPPRMINLLNSFNESYSSNKSNISNISNDYIPLVSPLNEIKNENIESKSKPIFHSNETTKVIEFTKTKAIINNKYKHNSAKITISELSDYDDIMPINCNIHKIDQYKYLIKGSKDLAKEIAEKILNWKEYDEKIELK